MDNFMCSKPTDLKLCRASTLLIQFNIGPTKGRNAAEMGLFSG
jgi:hypothetical protein